MPMVKIMTGFQWKFVVFVIASYLAITGKGVRGNEDLFFVSTPSLVEVNHEFSITFWTEFALYPYLDCSWDFNDTTAYYTNAGELQGPLSHNYTQAAVYNIITICYMGGTLEGYFSEVLVYSEIFYEICSYRSVNLTYDYDIYVLGESDLLVFYHHEFPDPLYYYMELDGFPVFEQGFSHGALDNDQLYAVPLDTLLFPIDLQNIIGLGVHNVSVTVYSEINTTAVYCESQVKFVELISGLIFYVSDFVVETNAPFIGSLAAESGWPALIEWSAWNEDENTLDFYFDSYRQARTPGEVDEVWLYISKPGNYTVKASLYHEINEASEYTTVIVENPVTTLDIFTNAPLRFPLESTFEMFVNYTSDGIPTDVDFHIDYGDGTTELFLPVPHEPDYRNITVSHTYAVPDFYTVQLFLHNYVSSVHHKVYVDVFEDIEDVTLQSFSGDDGSLTATLPLDFSVVFNAHLVKGTIELCEWNIGGDLINTTNPTMEYKFPAEGVYAIEVNVSNAFSRDSDNLSVTIVQGITGLYLINDGPVMQSNAITFVLFSYQLGWNSVFAIDYGDGTSETLPEPQVQENITQHIPSDLDLPFNPTEYLSIVVEHTYTSAGSYPTTAFASNAVSSRQASSDAFVQALVCLIPTMHILDGDSSYSSAKQYHRHKRIQFAADVVVDCSTAASTSYQWLVFKLDEVFTVPVDENRYQLPDSIRTNLTTLYVPAFTLEYGTYVSRLQVTVSLKDGSVGVNKDDQTYVSVVQSPLIAYIDGGSSIAIGWYHDIHVDGSLSTDPDSEGNENYLMFSWFCRRSNETYPTNEDLLLLVNQPSGDGGCLDEGYFMQSSNETTLTIPAQTLEGNQTHVFRLIVSKQGREDAQADQTITILPGYPPTILIRCITNCGPSLNPSERLVLSAKCEDCTLQTRPRYLWSLKLIPGALNHSKQELNWDQDTTTSRTNAYLAIRANTFQGSEEYILKVDVNSWSGASTFAEYAFATNAPPQLGTCTASPDEGVVLETHFTILCQGFMDQDEPLSYEVRALTGSERTTGISSSQDSASTGTLIYFGVDPHIPPTYLPVGLASHDYQVDISIRVSDTYGASIRTAVVVKVKAPVEDTSEPYTTVTDTVLEFTSGEENALSSLVDSGDTQSATQLVYTLTSLLNAEAESDFDQAASATEEEQEEDGDFRAEKKTKRAEARESIIASIRQIEVRDMETLQQTSAAIAQVTQEKDEISATAQLSAAESYQEMCSFLKAESGSGSSGGDTVEETASFIMVGLSNIMEAAFSTLASAVNETDTVTDTNDEAGNAVSNTRNVTMASLKALEELQTAVLQNKVPGEDSTVISTEAVSLVLQRQERWEVASKVRDTKAGASYFQLPGNVLDDDGGESSYDDIVDSHIHNYNHNPFAWASVDGNDITSQVSSLELELSNGDQHTKLTLTNLTQDIDIFIENKNPQLPQPLQAANVTESGEILYRFNITSQMAYVVVEVVVYNQSLYEPFPELYLSLTSNDYGLNSSFTAGMDTPVLNTSFPAAASPPVSAWNETMNITGNPYLWIVPFSEIGVEGAYGLVPSGWEIVNQSDVAVYAFGAQCVYWNTNKEMWDTDGCKVGPLTSRTLTHCQCNHLSHFAAGFVVLPNTVNFVKDAALFAKILENPVTALTVGTVFALYVLVAVWAKRRDRRAKEQAHVIFLGDNNPEAQYKYHVTVFTGMRRGAGTSAVATITLYGTGGSSEPHVLSTEGKRKILQRGGVDSFVLTTHGSLEDLMALRLWHDNSGNKPEWHLNRILVHDLHTHQLWYFLCHTWLAVDLGEFTVDKTFPVATPDDLRDFQHLFITRLLRDMKDHHLWVSIFTRPLNSNFTRLQRVTCCFTLLMMSMLTSIMFFGITPDDVDVGDSKAPDMSQEIGMGTIRVTWFDILVGIESGLLVLPGNLLILEIFRNARSRHPSKGDTSSIEIVAESEDDKSGTEKAKSELSTKSIASASSTDDDVPHHAGDGGQNHSEQNPSEAHPQRKTCHVAAEGQVTHPENVIMNSEEKKEHDIESHMQSVSQSFGIDSTADECSKPVGVSVSSIHLSTTGKPPPCCCLRSCYKGADIDDVDLGDDLSYGTEFSGVVSSSDSKPESSKSGTGDPQNGPPFFMGHEDYLHHHINKVYEELYNAPEGFFRSEEDRKKALRKLEETLKAHGWYQYLPGKEEGHAEDEDEDKAGCCKGKGCLPWWFVYVGWFFVVVTNLICGYLVILYGLSYGLQTSMDWLVSMVVTLVQSVFVLQPGKVIMVAAFFAIIWKKHEDDDVGVDLFTDADTGVFMTPATAKGRARRPTMARYYQPPPIESVNQAKQRRESERKMCKMIKELLGQILLVVLALEVAHFQRDPNTYMFHQSMADAFTAGFEDVSSINDVYGYLEDSFLPELYGETRGFLGDDSTYRVGRARLRQVRILPDACTPPESTHHIINCTGTLRSQKHTDRRPYNMSWSELLEDDTESAPVTESNDPWMFTLPHTSHGSYHMGTVGRYTRGGYIQVLGSTAHSTLHILQQLQEQKWLDEFTRALYIEWTVFSADVGLLCVCTALFEATTMGNVVSTGEFHAFKLFSSDTFVEKVNLALQSVYILVILALIRLEYRKMRRKKRDYFNFWNILNLLTIICSILSAVFYCLWAASLTQTMNTYVKDPSKFTSFFFSVLMDQIFMVVTGFLVLINTLRCAKILRFNSSIQTVNHTFHNMGGQFFSFTLTLFIFLFAFAILFCVTFGSDVMDFQDIAFSFQTIFLFLEGGYEEFMDVSEFHPNLGPVYFIFMTFSLFFLLFNFFILLILYAFRDARRTQPNQDHKDVLAAIVDWAFSVLSIKRVQKNDKTEQLISNIKR